MSNTFAKDFVPHGKLDRTRPKAKPVSTDPHPGNSGLSPNNISATAPSKTCPWLSTRYPTFGKAPILLVIQNRKLKRIMSHGPVYGSGTPCRGIFGK